MLQVYAVQIEETLRVVTAPNPGMMTGAGTNQYLVGHKRVTLIDAALGEGENVERLERELDAYGASVERIVLTHIHPDHLGGASALRRRFDAPLGMHASRAGYGGLEPDWTYDDGSRIEFDGGFLEVIHTPGHESGHCCFFEPERRWLFTGDHVVGEGTVVIAPPDGNMARYLESLDRLLRLPARLLLGGHGPVIRDPRAKIREYIHHRLEREAQVLDCVRRGLDRPSLIVAEIYREVGVWLHPVAEKSVEAHLRKLEDEGHVRLHGSAYVAP